jgi:predicted kinase
MRVPVAIVSCRGDRATLAARLLQRAAGGKDPSDANLTVLDAQLRQITPFGPSEQRHMVAIDTDAPNPVQRAAAGIEALRAV